MYFIDLFFNKISCNSRKYNFKWKRISHPIQFPGRTQKNYFKSIRWRLNYMWHVPHVNCLASAHLHIIYTACNFLNSLFAFWLWKKNPFHHKRFTISTFFRSNRTFSARTIMTPFFCYHSSIRKLNWISSHFCFKFKMDCTLGELAIKVTYL